MSTLIKYRFSINGTTVYPIWADGMQKDSELESGQEFFREKLSEVFKFVDADYDFIDGEDFDTEFILLVEKSNDNGANWSDYWTGSFYKTDCDWDVDDKKIEVKPEVKDQYTEVLAGLDNEYDLIKLGVARERVTLAKRPVLQMYVPGSNVIGCYQSGNAWEQETAFSEDNTSTLINTYKFALGDTFYSIDITGAGSPQAAVGNYSSDDPTSLDNKNGDYSIERQVARSYTIASKSHGKTSSDIGSIWSDGVRQWRIISVPSSEALLIGSHLHNFPLNNTSIGAALTHVSGAVNTGDIIFSAAITSFNYDQFILNQTDGDTDIFYSDLSLDLSAPGNSFPDDAALTFHEIGGSGTFTGTFQIVEVYTRFLTNVTTFSGNATSVLPTEDIGGNSRNYSRVIGLAVSGIISSRAVTEPTPYGLNDYGEYFYLPTQGFLQPIYPMARSSWGNFSLWFVHDATVDGYIDNNPFEYELQDAMQLHSVIHALLQEIDPSISFYDTSAYSEFLYAASNPVSSDEFKLFLTQKSNILAGEYDRPAQKAPVRLGNLLQSLYSIYQLKWYIDSSDRFRLEHVSWFKNGGSYSTTANVGIDLTSAYNSRLAETWGFNLNKYNYDKEELPERYEFSWMDEVTDSFDGSPIRIESKLIQRGNIESVSVPIITTDVDYMLVNPSAINPDGFVLMAAELVGGNYVLPMVDYTLGNYTFTMQNGLLSWTDLHPKYWRDDMPTAEVYINDVATAALSLKRSKKQTIRFPAQNDPNPLLLIKTGLGDGQIEKISVNLSSRICEIVLKYDTE